MYSNNKKGFSILDLLVKIIFAGIFIFILVWLFQKKIPNINMDPFYSNVFRENIKYMQDAGESYFTDDKMPTTVGETYKLTLDEMEKLNIILPFVDKDGKACDKTESYVSVTKLEDNAGYELKTNLVCGKESNFVTKILGCHNYCPGNNCNNACSVEKRTEYQYKRLVSGTGTKYYCDKGFTLKGKYCIKTTLKDSYSAAYTTTETVTTRKPADVKTSEATLKELKVVVTEKKTQLTTVVTDKKTQLTTVVGEKKTELTPIKGTTSTQLTTIKTDKQEAYSCTKTKTERQCTTVYEKEAYQCNCTTKFVGGVLKTSCDTCYKSVPVQKCSDVKVEYTDTCYRTVSTYSCPSGTNRQTGSGSSLKCYKDTTTYSCPSTATSQTGSGANLKCYKTEKTYSCPSGTTTQEGSGANLKCYKVEKVYSCPSGTDVQEGSGTSLKCYKIVNGTVTYYCKDKTFKLDGKTCVKTETKTVTKYRCTKTGYKLEGKKCNLYETKKVNAKTKKIDTSKYEYKWSRETELAGWTRTGKTRTVDGEEICK